MSQPLKKKWVAGYYVVNEEQVKRARYLGLTAEQVWVRIHKLKWTVEDAVSKPIRVKQVKPVKKDEYSVDWGARINQLKQELMELERQARKVNSDALQVLINQKRRKIKRFEINAKNYWR